MDRGPRQAYSPWGYKESDTTEHAHTHTHTHTHTPDNEAKILLKLINGLYQIIVLFFVT